MTRKWICIAFVANFFFFNSQAQVNVNVRKNIYQPDQHLPVKNQNVDLRPMKRWLNGFKRIEINRIHSNGVLNFTVNNDRYGFRIGEKDNKSYAKNHAIFSGCSYIFGDGVKDEETLPAQISQLMQNHQVYNTGVMGGSPQEHLYLWSKFDQRPLVNQSSGFMYYNLFTDQFERIAHTWRYLNWISDHSPTWTHDRDTHDFKYDDIISERMSWKFMYVLKFLHLDYWWLRATSHFIYLDLKNSDDLMIDYLLALKAEYLKQYPLGRFIVGKAPLMPLLPLKMQAKEQAFLIKLKAKKLEYIETSELDKRLLSLHNKDFWFFKGEGHPIALYYQEQAKFLAPILGNLE